MKTLWNKGEAVDAAVLRYTVGQDYRLDARLVAFDVQASQAHAQMLMEAGYLSEAERAALGAELTTLAAEHAAGGWAISLEEEDCHTALENRLTERLGPLGGRIHLGRSRNDQVLAALRLYLLDAIERLGSLGEGVCQALGEMRQSQGHIPLPGYTHLQRAMPSSVDLWAGAYEAEIQDDLLGLRGARRRAAKNPLGSAAGYGVPHIALSRARTTELLPFEEIHEPVTAVQLSRGKAEAALCFELCLLMQDMGRLASDVCLFATAEFAFVTLPAAFTTGSSIMPQKRNPDLFELMRANAAQMPAHLMAIFALTQKMPSGYHRDLQLIKAPLFQAIDLTEDTLTLLGAALPGMAFQEARTRAAMDPSLYATERAYRLVEEEGIPFRDAYRRVASELKGET